MRPGRESVRGGARAGIQRGEGGSTLSPGGHRNRGDELWPGREAKGCCGWRLSGKIPICARIFRGMWRIGKTPHRFAITSVGANPPLVHGKPALCRWILRSDAGDRHPCCRSTCNVPTAEEGHLKHRRPSSRRDGVPGSSSTRATFPIPIRLRASLTCSAEGPVTW
jgi:hypothetical protein